MTNVDVTMSDHTTTAPASKLDPNVKLYVSVYNTLRDARKQGIRIEIEDLETILESAKLQFRLRQLKAEILIQEAKEREIMEKLHLVDVAIKPAITIDSTTIVAADTDVDVTPSKPPTQAKRVFSSRSSIGSDSDAELEIDSSPRTPVAAVKSEKQPHSKVKLVAFVEPPCTPENKITNQKSRPNAVETLKSSAVLQAMLDPFDASDVYNTGKPPKKARKTT